MIWYEGLFSFKGRLNREGFWIGMALNLAIFILFSTLFLYLEARFDQKIYMNLALATLCLSIFIFFAVAIKRLHDRGRSGFGSLISILPFICYMASIEEVGLMSWALGRFLPMFIVILMVLDWGVFKGQPQANNYGEQGQTIKFINKE